ncbi:MAG: helix-turn-helix domain-containing protein [Lachnospiraceae bacterium]|nr:helix-turn-helix domain-containing protein [Lachnospiraceae bacterium]
MFDIKESGRFVALCRQEKGLTQKQLGDLIGVTDKAVSKWETGRSFPDAGLIEPLCAALETSVGELFAGKRIAPEQCEKETGQLLIEAFGSCRLYGIQVVLYLLDILALLAWSIPFLLRDGYFFPELNVVNGISWGMSLILIAIIFYLDHVIPERGFRTTNIWLEGAGGLLSFIAVVITSIFMISPDVMETATGKDKLIVLGVFLVCAVDVVAERMIMAYVRRKKHNNL